MKVKVLLLAGGLGTRLRPLTDHTPKCLVPIAGRPLLDYWLDRFAAAGIRDIRINTHHHAERMREYIRQKNQTTQFRISESYEPVLLGSAGTVAANAEWVSEGEIGVIVYADNLSNVNLSSFLEFHQSHDDPFSMLLFRTPYPEKCGIARLDSAGRIVEFIEKPKHPIGDLANGGIYALSDKAYREMADMKAFDLAFDVLPSFVGRMRGWVWSGYHRDIGTPESLRQAELDAAAHFGLRSGEAHAGSGIS